MSISQYLAAPIACHAAKSFVHHYDPHKPSLKSIFHDYWDRFLVYANSHNIKIRDVELYEVARMIRCGTIDMGFEIFECPNCHRYHIIAYTCKSRFCPSCGVKMTRERAFRIADSTLDVNHRHIVFTIDYRLRIFFKTHPAWLRFLFDAAWETLSHVFNNSNARKGGSFTPGVIITLHTFGRDLKWNPHVHCLVTEGGMDESHTYKAIDYIHYPSLRKSFMKLILDKLRDAFPPDSKERSDFIRLRSLLYDSDRNGFYVNGPPRKVKGNAKKQVVQYMIRYAGRPAMAQSRITAYDFQNRAVSYWYEDHKTGKQISVTEDVFDFFRKLIQHIPEPQFKMVRYYGLYATCDHRHKKAVNHMRYSSGRSNSYQLRPHSYRERLIDTFGVDPFLCTCGHYMVFVDRCITPFSMVDDESPP